MIRVVRPFLFAAAIFAALLAPSVRAYEQDSSGIWDAASAERAFSSGSSWFSSGPAWLMNAMPGSTRRYVLDRSGDLVEATPHENEYIGTLRDVWDFSLYGNASAIRGASASGSQINSPSPDAILANTADNYTGTATGNVTTPGNWSLSAVPTITNDAVFTSTSLAGIKNFGTGAVGPALTVGSLNVTATTGSYSIRNDTSTATNAILTLGGPGSLGNSVSGNSADLLFAATGSTLQLLGTNGGGGTGVLNVVLGQSGNFNAAGSIVISSVISDGGSGFGITKTGVGTLTLSGVNTYGGGTTISAGTLLMSGSGTLGSTTATLNLSGTGILSLGSTNQTVGGIVITAPTTGTTMLTGTGTLTLNGNLSYSSPGNNNFPVTLGASTSTVLDLGGGTRTFTITGNNNSSGDVLVNALIQNGGINYVGVLGGPSNVTAPIMNFLSANTYGLGTTVSGSAILQLGASDVVTAGVITSGPVGTGLLTLGTGTTLRSTSSTARTLENNLSLSGNIVFGATSTQTGALTFDSVGLTAPSTVTLTANTGLTTNVTTTIANAIGGSFALSKTGSGTLTLSGASTFSNGLTITTGVLQIGSSSVLSGGVISTGPVGTGLLTLGTGTTLRSTAATTAGDRTLQNSLSLGGSVTMGDSSLSGVLTFNSTGLTTPAAISLTSNTTLTTNSAVALNSVVGGSGINLTKAGTATLALGANNTFSGSFTANAGTTYLNANGALGSVSSVTIATGSAISGQFAGLTNVINDSAPVTINGNGFLDVSGGSETLASLTSSSSTSQVFTGDNAGAGSITIGDSSSTTFAGIISGTRATAGSIFTKQGSGTLTLSGANTFSGAVSINAGTLGIAVSNVSTTSGALGVSANTINLGDTGGTAANTSLLTTGAFTFSNNITVRSGNAGIATIGGNSANSSTFSGAITLNKDLTITAITGGTVNLTKSISNATGTNTVNITGAGTSNIILNNATTNQFAPTIFSIASGKLSLGASNQIGDGTGLTILGGTFDLLTFSDTAGAVVLGSGNINGTTGVLSGSSYDVQSGSASAILGGAGALTKTTGGTVTLTGLNTYSGGSTITSGILNIGNNNALSTGTLNINGGTLQSDGSTARAVAVSQINIGGDFTIGGANTGALSFSAPVDLTGATRQITDNNTTNTTIFSGVISNGGLTKLGNGQLNLTGAGNNTYTGLTTVSAGTLGLGKNVGVNAFGGDLLINGGTVLYSAANNNQIPDASNVSLSSGTFNFGARTETINSLTMSGGTLSKDGNVLTITSASSITGGTLNFNAATSEIALQNSLALGGATFNYTTSATPSGGLTLGGDVTYAASNTAAGTFNNTGGGVGRLNLGGATRTFDVANSNTLGAGISELQIAWSIQNGGLTKTGAGVMTLFGANTYGGGTTVNNGTLQLSGSGTLGSTTGSLTINGGSVDLNGTNQTVGALNGTGGQVNNSTGSSVFTVGNGGGSGSYAGSITNLGTIALTKTGAGTQTLTNNNSYTGATVINGGILELANSGGVALAGTSGVTVNNGGTLLFSGNNQINQATFPGITVDGGKMDAGGFSQGTGGTPAIPSSGAVGLGALTMNSSSIIDLTGTSVFHFSDSSAMAWTGTLSIWDWTGTATTGGGAEQILFGNTVNGLNSGQLLQISFYSDGGSTLISNTALILADGEIIPGPMTPVPEPSTWIGAALALGAIGFTQRRKLRGFVAQRA
jgi:autotransporter-associated beta strand protein